MVSDEFKKMIKSESDFKIEKRILHLDAKARQLDKISKALENYLGDDEKQLYEDVCMMVKVTKAKAAYCRRVLSLRRKNENEQQM